MARWKLSFSIQHPIAALGKQFNNVLTRYMWQPRNGCICHWVQGRQNDGSKGPNGVGKEEDGVRTHSSEECNQCACLDVVGGMS